MESFELLTGITGLFSEDLTDLIVLHSNSKCPVLCFIIYGGIWLNGSFLVAGVTFAGTFFT